MKLVIGADHAGWTLKDTLIEVAKAKGAEVRDFGTHTGDPVDYPDFALQVARAVAKGEAALGLLVCGTGIGMSIAANKVHGIRAAVCSTEFEARAARAHNDANVLCVGQRVIGPGVAAAI